MRRLTIEADGASRGNPGPSAIGVVVLDESGAVVAEVSRYLGDDVTNNTAEWSAIIAGIEEARRLDATSLQIRMDSELVVKQLRGEYRVRDAKLRPLALKAQELLRGLSAVEIEHVPRARNARADALANQALDTRRGSGA
jgi:ribonuclease HI